MGISRCFTCIFCKLALCSGRVCSQAIPCILSDIEEYEERRRAAGSRGPEAAPLSTVPRPRDPRGGRGRRQREKALGTPGTVLFQASRFVFGLVARRLGKDSSGRLPLCIDPVAQLKKTRLPLSTFVSTRI